MLIALLVVTVLVGAVLQRVVGFGFGLVAAPVFVLLLGPGAGVIAANIVGLFNCALIVSRVHNRIEWRRVALLGTTALLIMIPYTFMLRTAETATQDILVGLVVIIGMSISLITKQLRAGRRPWKQGAPLPTVIVAVIAAFGAITAGVAGPPLAAYAVLDDWEPHRFAATIQPVFMIISISAVGSQMILGGQSLPAFHPAVWLLVAATCVGALFLGDYLTNKVSTALMQRFLVVIAYLGGAVALTRGLELI